MRAVKDENKMTTAARVPSALPWVVLLAAALIALGSLVALRLSEGHPTASGSNSPVLVGEAVMPAGSTPAPNFSLRDQNGQTVALAELRGRVVGLTFLDSHCQQACPVTGDQLGTAMRALGSRTPFTLLVVSVAPATDTPASETAFAATHRWMGSWHWLSGTPAELATVWKTYGIDVQPGTPGDIAHSVVTYLIDRKGFERVGLLFTQPSRVEQDVRILARS